MKRTILLLFMAALSPISTAPAADAPATISALKANGARVVELGARGGLDGYLVEPAAGDPYSLYLTSDGYAVAGLLYGPDGNLITGDQIAAVRNGSSGNRANDPGSGAAIHIAHAYEGAAPAPDAEALFERSAAAFGFTLGEAGPLVVLFGDPTCRWSRAAAARLARQALAGRFRLHVIPVGLLGAAAARKAAAIASSPDSASAWFDRAVAASSPEGARRITRNNALHDAWGETAVPLIAWRNARGRIERRIGDIDDLDIWLKELSR